MAVPLDPVLPVKAFFDIGGAGHSSDAMAIWVCQFVGREIRLLDYIERVGQPLGFYVTSKRVSSSRAPDGADVCKHLGQDPKAFLCR
jgi:phage terminase large subunit